MSTDQSIGYMRGLWQLPRVRELMVELEPFVVHHMETVVASIAEDPPLEPVYCLALVTSEYSSTVRDGYDCGVEADRVALIEANDHLSVWNYGLFNEYVSANRDPHPDEERVRLRLAENGVSRFGYWLLSEVARRLNYESVAPELATSDFVVYCMDDELSEDFELALAYSTPEPIYSSFVARGLSRPSSVQRPGPSWINVGQ